MVRRLGLIVALIATLLPISALIPGLESAVSARAQVATATTPANEVNNSSVASESVRLASGGAHTCAIFELGTVKCWGWNFSGQLGNGTNTRTNTPGAPINLGTNRTATAITAGYRHTCAILDDNTVKCWGGNPNGQLGNSTNTDTNTPGAPINLGTNRTATAISAGSSHTCAILDNGAITCWGFNFNGRLGNSTNTDTDTPGAPINLGTNRTAKTISAGTSHTCAILDDNTVKCWGYNRFGQLGNSTNTDTNTPGAPINLGTNRTAKTISAGSHLTCAILDDSTVKCWGDNSTGQLGNGTNTNTNTPGAPINLGTNRTATAISNRSSHTCALLDNGQFTCWGLNNEGQLGNGNRIDSTVPYQFPTLTDVTPVQTPFAYPYVLKFRTSDSIYGVESSDFTNAGTASNCTYELEYDSFPSNSDIVVTVKCATPGTIAVSLNAYSIRTETNVWGPTQPFSFQNGSTSKFPAIADVTAQQPDGVYPYYVQFKTNVDIDNIPSNLVTIPEPFRFCSSEPDRTSAKANEVIAFRIDCFNSGKITPTITLNAITSSNGITGPTSTFSFAEHTIRSSIPVITNTTPSTAPQNPLVLRFSSSVAYTNLVASDFSYTGSATGCTFTPTASAAAKGVENIVVVRCTNLGSITPTLKMNSISSKYVMGPLSNFSFGTFTVADTIGSKVLDVSAGEGHTCAILTNHALKCWGDNENGELGLGDNLRRYVPAVSTVNLGNDRLAIEVVATYGITCVLLDNATTKCWGNNDVSQLGDNSNIDLNAPSSSPINFGPGELVSTISVNRTHGCASLMTGVVRCWGLNNRGQLGIGTTTFSRTPSPQAVSFGLGRTAKRVYAGRDFSCAILDNNTAKCWGAGSSGELGQGFSDLLAPPTDPINYGIDTNGQALWPKSLSTNESNVCALLNNNSVKCSGWNRYYQLGDGSPSYSDGDVVKNMTSALNFGVGQVPQQISVGGEHACVLLVTDQIKCWGDGFYNIGYENRSKYQSPPNATINLGTNTSVLKVSAGFHTCAILSDSTLKCWGYNTRGAVGVSPTANPWDLSNIGDAVGEMGDALPRVAVKPLMLTIASPAAGQSISNPDDLVLSLSAGFSSLQSQDFSYTGTATGCSFVPSSASATDPSLLNIRVRCASSGTVVPRINSNSFIDADQNVYPGAAFEFPSYNIASASEIIENTTTYSPTSRRFTLRLSFSEVVSAITSDDFINTATSGAATCSYVPSSSNAIPGIDIILSVSCTTDGALNLSLRADSITAVGGAQVPPTSQGIFSTTIRAADPNNPVQVSGGAYHTCTLLSDGSAKCWGNNDAAQLGNGTRTETSTPGAPINFGTGRTATAITTGESHTCAILDDGTVKCWGSNFRGQRGNGNTENTGTPSNPLNLGSGRTATAITAGSRHTCAILDTGTVSCWGSNLFGQLGNGNDTNTYTPGAPINLGTGRTATAITAGDNHTCALLDDSTVTCWGDNYRGQLGNGTNTDTYTPGAPINLGTGRTATAITAGDNHTCAILDNSTVKCWGYNNAGQLGNGNNTDTKTPGTPINLGTNRTATAITADSNHTCAILDNSTVTCWGNNFYGQLGNGNDTNTYTPGTPINLGNGRTAVEITTGDNHTCAILDNSTLNCWGYNFYGQLGNGTNTNTNALTYIVNLDRAKLTESTETQPDTASPYVLKFTTDQAIYGITASDFTFSGTATGCSVSLAFDSYPAGEVSVPVNCETEGTIVATLNTFSVSDLYGTRLAPTQPLIFASHTYNSGPLTVSNTTGSTSTKEALVVRFSASKAFTGLDSSDFSYTGTASGCTFAPSTSSAAKGISVIVLIRCLTAGTVTPTLASVSLMDPLGLAGPVASLTFETFSYEPLGTSTFMKPIAVTAGHDYSCATVQNGKVVCWGSNLYGQLGNGNNISGSSPSTAVSFSTLVSVSSVAAGGAHTCALTNTGSVTCWGDNQYGQLGNNGNQTRDTPSDPITLPNGRTATAITAGFFHTCALLDNGQITCWGLNLSGQLGNGTNTNTDAPGDPITLPNGRTATAITAGFQHTCALLDNGTISCWGNNLYRQLGNNGDQNRNTPSDPITLRRGRIATAVTAGFRHTCALLDNGTISCWGNNEYGQLGNGGGGTSNTPNLVVALPDGIKVTEVRTGEFHTCALLDNGQITCWGDNMLGQLGLGTRGNTNRPRTTVNLGVGLAATGISIAGNHSCSLIDNRAVKCWGYNGRGQLGLGEIADRGLQASDMGDNLPYVGVSRLIAYSETSFSTTVISPFTFTVKFNGDFSGLDSSDFSYSGNAGNCRFAPASTRGQAYVNVAVTVRCATAGTFTPTLNAFSVIDPTGVSGPQYSMIIGTTNVVLGAGFVIDTTSFKPSTLDFILRAKFDSAITGLTSSDFSNNYVGSDAATGCTFTPASSSIAGGLDVIIRVHCDGAGFIEPVLAINSVADSISTGPSLPLSFGTHLLNEHSTTRVVSIDSGAGSNCAIFNDGRAKCWGDNLSGQLGYNDVAGRGSLPTELGTSLPFIAFNDGQRVSAISTSDFNTCALLDNGQISCWGDNQYGQLGNGNTTDTNTPGAPINLGNDRTATAITTGGYHTCALLDNGRITCWGYNFAGQLGNGNTTDTNTPGAPINLGNDRTATAITTGTYHTCALLDNGQVTCWGRNNFGQLGSGNTTDTNTPGAPINLGNGRTATAVTTKGLHTCALLDNGQVTCFGLNQNGQLGKGNTNSNNAPNTTVTLPTGRTATAISTSSDDHTCALLDNGQVTCWGRNNFGQLGSGNTTDTNTPGTPINVGSDRRVITVSSGQFHNCALLDDSTVKCWGSNGLGQLGLGDTNHRADNPNEMGDDLPTVNLLAPSVSASSIIDQSNKILFSLTFSDSILGLGSDDFINTGTATDCTFRPWSSQAIAGVLTVIEATCETSGSVIISLKADSVYEVNGNTGPYSSFNLPVSSIDVDPPVISAINELTEFPLTFVTRIKPDEAIIGLTSSDFRISGTATDCGLQVSSASSTRDVPIALTVECKASGSLVIELKADSITDTAGNSGPATDLALPTFSVDEFATRIPVSMSVGGSDSCALMSSAQVRCWGRADSNVFGGSFTGEYGETPNELGDDLPTLAWSKDSLVTSFARGTNKTCATLSNGSLQCFKTDGTNEIYAPIDGDSFISVDIGRLHSCALNNSGKLRCWGSNSLGQLGTGDTNNQVGLVVSLTSKPVIEFSSGMFHTCAILVSRELQCWGANAWGQLGDGTTNHSATPITVDLGTGRTAVAVSTGASNTCAILDNGRLKCWGDNPYGQLGVGDAAERLTPTAVDLGSGRTAIEINSRGVNTCAILDNNDLKCWGWNLYGQVGKGNTTNQPTPGDPIDLGTGRTAIHIAKEFLHTCAILDNGQIKCWGKNDWAQLGIGSASMTAFVGDGENEMGDALVAVKLASAPIAVDTTGTIASLANPFVMKMSFDHKVTGLTWQDFSFVGSTATNCNAAPQSETVESLTDVEIYVSCTGSGNVVMNLEANSVIGQNGAVGPSTRFTFNTITGLDVSPPTITESVTPPVLRNGGTFTFTSDKWFEGLKGSVFTSTGTAQGCTFTPLADRSEAGVPVEIAINCTSDGTIEPVLPASSFVDFNGNPGPNPMYTFAQIRVDNTSPTATIDMPTPTPTLYPFSFTTIFSENVSGITGSDFVNAGTATGCAFTPTSTTASQGVPLSVAVTCATSGTITPQLAVNTVADTAGNNGPVAQATGGSISITIATPPTTTPPSNRLSALSALTPARILNTRSGVGVRAGRVVNQSVELQVTGSGGVPSSGVSSVSMNVTVTDTSAGDTGGYVTVYPCGALPDASNLNFIAGQTIPNAVITPVSASGKVCFYVFGGAHLIADVNGWSAPGSGFTPVNPARVLNTRGGSRVVNSSTELQVTGVGAIPSSGVGAVSLNVTVTTTTAGDAGGYVTVYPCGTLPDASNLNFIAGQTIPNAVITPVSASGKVCFYVYGGAHLIADINGWYATGNGFVGVTPARVLNTRGASRVVGTTKELQVTGVGAIPASGVGAVSLNVTVTDTTADDFGGYVTVYPCGTRPEASNLNFVSGQTIPNAVITPVSANGKVCFYVFGGAHLIADINGYYTS